MFGKKKADGAKKAGGEKKAKRKSRSGGGAGGAQIKTFLAENIEKLVLGVVALLSLYLVYSGFSKEGLSTDPDAVRQAVQSAEGQMQATTWSEVRDERVPEPDTFDQRATLDTIPLDSEAYQPDQCGVIIADGYDAEIVRHAPLSPLAAARRKAETEKLARAAMRRHTALLDPDCAEAALR